MRSHLSRYVRALRKRMYVHILHERYACCGMMCLKWRMIERRLRNPIFIFVDGLVV